MRRPISNDLYLVILDENSKLCHGMPYRKGNVPSVWTQVFSGRVRTFRDLIGRYSHLNIPFKTHSYWSITVRLYGVKKSDVMSV